MNFLVFHRAQKIIFVRLLFIEIVCSRNTVQNEFVIGKCLISIRARIKCMNAFNLHVLLVFISNIFCVFTLKFKIVDKFVGHLRFSGEMDKYLFKTIKIRVLKTILFERENIK